MKAHLLLITGLLIAATAAFACGCTGTTADTPAETDTTKPELLVYCGAGMREPMEEIAATFTNRTGIPINFIFGGSNTLLTQMELTGMGDVYMPGATAYFDAAREKGLVEEEHLIVYHVPVIAVPKGNPAGITSLEDMAKPGVRVALGDTATAIGELTDKLLAKNNLLDDVNKNVVTRSGTVNELLVYISMGQADVGIIWEDLYVPEKMDLIYIPNADNLVKIVPIGVLTSSEHPTEAEQFTAFVISDEGKEIFTRHGFVTYPSDTYADVKP
ncbi:molybdate ABC transporter substrate-binding protein [Methanoculleus sp. DTU007]|mgnify:CR=1 FL=1|jgi:molybdate transport system substrate-binding protein|uniref:molybdate ABC transporter substrate-binding protein n=1 Tax=Methanoculleus sp. DTU007 TaxID=1671626 RepID=UPI000AE9E8A3|nr:molybdate ABC transporter substrate-binding protein [Methanoculleus sp. DTU007]MDK2916609.1 molybdate transport system substrate-binding protein [Euryarchaeota archaeon]MDN5339478.1 molybdate transport system substrate-binding protein [Euryarchaeota archaeon]